MPVATYHICYKLGAVRVQLSTPNVKERHPFKREPPGREVGAGRPLLMLSDGA